MRKIILYSSLAATLALRLAAQVPSSITMPSPTPTPTVSIDTYTRASSSIYLQNGFDYGFTGAGATNFLNLNISNYPPYVNNNYPNVPDWYSPDEGATYGVTSGAPGVGSDGAFQYSIPIECAPGTAGVQPELAIVYNHNAGNSWLGMGFNMAGLSAVSRTSKTAFYDGANAAITFSSSDVFELDGQRLSIATGTYGTNGATYRFEEDNFNTISSVVSGGALYFVVNTRDGRTIEYGSASNARNTAKSSSDVLHWCINKVTDAFGNYMTYSYTNVNGEMLIDNIQYTGNGSTAPYNSIAFTYMDRSDPVPTLVSGRQFDRTKLLKKIVCYGSSGTAVRQYILDYDFTSASYLRRVSETDALGNQLNPTGIDYVNNASGATTCSAHIAPNISTILSTIAADMDGDGLQDIVSLNNSSGPVTVDIGISYANGTSRFSVPSGSFVTSTLSSTLITLIDTYVFDEDDDNRDEVFFLYKDTSASAAAYTIARLKFNGSAYDINTEVNHNLSGSFAHWNPDVSWLFFRGSRSGFLYAKEDVTGDNLRDVIVGDPLGFTVTPSGGTPITTSWFNLKVQLGDFDNDGTMELYTLAQPAIYSGRVFYVNVFKYQAGSSTFSLVANTPTVDINQGGTTMSSASSITLAPQYIQLGDIDGDGKTDVFYLSLMNSTFGNVACLRSNGQNFVSQGNNPLNVPLTLNLLPASFYVSDTDLDGRDDWAATSHDNTGYTYFSVYPSNGSSLLPNNNGVQTTGDLLFGVTGDFDGDGAADYVSTISTSSYITDLNHNVFLNGNKRLVNRIRNMKTDYAVSYVRLPFAGVTNNVYLKGASNNPSAFKICAPKQFVANNLSDFGVNTTYRYYNGLMHRAGRGFLGFEKVTAISDNALSSISSYTFDGTYDYLLASESSQGTSATPTTAAHSRTDLSYTLTSGMQRYLGGSVSTARNYLGSTNSKVTIVYDNTNGSVSSHKQEWLPWSGGAAIRSEETDYTYSNSTGTASGAPLTRLGSSTVTTSNSGYSSSYETDYSYDAAGHLVSTVANANISGSAITASYSAFNAFGRPTVTQVSAPDLSAARGSTVQYDATGRYVLTSYNSLGNAEYYEYDPDQGVPTKYTDVAGLVTEYSYDGQGRLVKTKLPNHAINTVSYSWGSYAVTGGTNYGATIVTDVAGGGQSTVQLNCKDQPLSQEDAVWDSRTAVTSYSYNGLYQLVSKTEPHYSSAGSWFSYGYTYDSFFRLATASESLGATVTNTASYDLNTPSTDATYNQGYSTVGSANSASLGSSFTKRYNDEAGQIVKVVNYGSSTPQNTVTYQFNDQGQPVSATTGFSGGTGNAVTSFQYDALGRQSEISDPSANTTQFHYNSVGELTAQIKPTGASYTCTFTYDALGRLSQKTSSVGTTTMDYVTAGNGKQQLKKITGPEVITEYTYDNLGRPLQSKETLVNTPGKVFSTQLTYDLYGHVLNHTYPNGFVSTSQYDALGNLVKISEGSTTLWQLEDMSTPALISKYDYAQSFHNTLAYDSRNELSSLTNSLSVQTYSFYHGNGDLLSREYTNSSSSNNERFSYDGFNRLTGGTYTTSAAPTTPLARGSYSYQDNGNLTHKDDAGNYTYSGSGGPYAVTGFSPATGNTDVPGEMTVSYFNDLKRTRRIYDPNTSGEFNFVYGNDNERIKMTYSVSGTNHYTRYYQPGYDRQENANGTYKEWCYVYAPTGLCAVNYNNNGTKKTLQVTTDHLGSPLLLSDHSVSTPTVVEENSFDAWGRRRDPADWNTHISSSSILIRGYQMHEMLDEVGFINMNARLYDPIIGQFSQPDDYLQDPDNLQNFNRYAYCFNNPLKYADPSGNSAHYTPPAISSNVVKFYDYFTEQGAAVYVDGQRVHGGGEMDFWTMRGTGAASIYNFGFTGTSMSHLSQISAQGLNETMHTDNETPDFNSDHSTPEQRALNNSAPPGWVANLPQVDITANKDGSFSNPSYDIWQYANGGQYSYFMRMQNLQESMNWYNNQPSSGRLESDYTFDGGLIAGKITGAIFAKVGARVFWSGAGAKTAAAEFAEANSMKTLEMTTMGSIMNTVSPYLPRSISNPIWNNLSRSFAAGARGDVNFFTITAGPRTTSIWMNIEKPLLQQNGVNIITHIK